MRIGVLEWASCGGAVGVEPLPDSIRQEGWAMCRALIESIAKAGHTPVACLSEDATSRTGFPARPSFPARPPIHADIHPLNLNRPVRDEWREVYSGCDATIVVAPESDGIQLELEAWCAVAGLRTCSSDAQFIAHAGDKWLTAQSWQRNQVPQPATQLLSEWDRSSGYRDETMWVIKARDGAGCDGLQRLTAAELHAFRSTCAARDRWLVQPWLSGQACSRTTIVDAAGRCHWLPVVTQHLQVDMQVRYQGGRVLPEFELTAAQSDCLESAVMTLPGKACGWIGVDFLIADDGDLIAIEINPRLTTSFVGLSQACDVSMAEQIVRAKLAMEVILPRQWREVGFVSNTAWT